MRWGDVLVDQLDFYLRVHLLPRLEGLSDEEYFWEPVAGCWSVRRQGDGEWRVDGGRRTGPVPPVTTIAWRIVHVAGFNLGARFNAFFGPEPASAGATMHDPRHVPPVPGTASDAVRLLVDKSQAWLAAIRALSDDQLAQPLGPRGGGYAADPMAALVLHVNRETMHHGGEIGVLRDLYRAR